jgi:hypothetical protein
MTDDNSIADQQDQGQPAATQPEGIRPAAGEQAGAAAQGSQATASSAPAQPANVQTAATSAQTGSAASGAKPASKPAEPATKNEVRALGIFLLVLGVFLVYLFIILWPSGLKPDADGSSPTEVTLFYHRVTFTIPLDARLIFLVMVAGGLGSFVHIATSFSGHVAGGNLTKHWDWWYILRPGIGMVLALIFYLAIRGGFLSVGSEAGKINPFGIAGMAALVGMFSKQAVAKLNEVFNTLFKTTEGQQQDRNNPVPSVDGVQPQSIPTGSTDLGITITGKGFVTGAQVQVNGANRDTVLVDGTHLTATLAATDVANKGWINLTVVSPKPGGGTSNAVKIAVA